MATLLQLVDTNLTTVLFDFNSASGTGNPSGVITRLGVGGGFELHPGDPEFTTIAPPFAPGGTVVQRRDPLGVAKWRQGIRGASSDAMMAGIGELSRLFAKGGTLKWIADGSSETRYIRFEPSATPWVLDGREMGVWQIANRFTVDEGVEIQLTTQPYPLGAALSGTANKAVNATLIRDFDGTANRPDSWVWSATTGLSAETMSTDAVNWSYQFTKADGTAVNLQQTTAVASFASGDVATFSFYARVSAVAGTPQMQATLQFKQSDGTTNVGSLFSGGLVTLTTSWQRISVTTTAAGALTSRAQLSIQQDNADATSVTCQLRMAQAEVAASASLFRIGVESIAYDPASTTGARLPVYIQGTAPCPVRCSVASDSNGLGRIRIYRESLYPVDVSKQVHHKQLESGTLGANTASAVVSDSSASNAAQWTPTAANPALRADNSAGGTGNTITVTKPAGTLSGDVLVAYVYRTDETTSIAAPDGWKTIGFIQNTTGTYASLKGVLWAWYKVADAVDESAATASYTFTVVADAAGTRSYRAWVGAFSGVDNATPLDTYSFATESATTTPTAPTITTTRNNNMVVTIYSGHGASGALTFSTPAGATPTYTEQDDGTSDQTFRGAAVSTGVLATAGATSTKDSTAAVAIDAMMLNLALNIAPAAIGARSTVTFTSIRAGAYDVWLRHYPTAASVMRVRVEWAPMASPAIYSAFDDFILDTTGASAFAYADHLMGRLFIPEDFATATLTVKVSVGLDSTPAGSPLWNGDFVRLVKADELVGQMTSPTLLTTSEILVGDADINRAYHLDSSSQIKEIADVSGPVPMELEPGLNLLDFEMLKSAATGFLDRATVLATVHTITITHSPRYRV